MMEPWFSDEVSSRFALFSLLSLLAILEIPAKRGHHRSLVIGIWNAVVVLGGCLIAAATVGWFLGQPGHVVRALGATGLLIEILFLSLKKQILASYQEAELSKTVAQDL
jgi:hypothetical protein